RLPLAVGGLVAHHGSRVASTRDAQGAGRWVEQSEERTGSVGARRQTQDFFGEGSIAVHCLLGILHEDVVESYKATFNGLVYRRIIGGLRKLTEAAMYIRHEGFGHCFRH